MKFEKIILLGPLCTGKTLTSFELKNFFGLQHIPVDAIIWYYHIRNGIDFQKAYKLREEDANQYLAYCEGYNFKAVKSILKNHNGIIDFGATHTFFLNEEYRDKISRLMCHKNTFLLLPGKNENTNIEILNGRLEQRLKVVGRSTQCIDSWKSLNEIMLRKKNFQDQSKFHIFAGALSPKEVALNIYNHFKHSQSNS